jgi:hypothetical protein
MTPQQPPLFADAAAEAQDCAEGTHGPLLASPALEIGEAVNVDWSCSRCGAIVRIDSYTRDAWAKRKP